MIIDGAYRLSQLSNESGSLAERWGREAGGEITEESPGKNIVTPKVVKSCLTLQGKQISLKKNLAKSQIK